MAFSRKGGDLLTESNAAEPDGDFINRILVRILHRASIRYRVPRRRLRFSRSLIPASGNYPYGRSQPRRKEKESGSIVPDPACRICKTETKTRTENRQ
jgi:hypothetical protein